MERERERVDGARDHVGAGAGGFERVGERGAAGSLAVEPDREPGRLLDAADQLAGLVRLESATRIVDERARRFDLRQLARLLDELVDRALVSGAVDEAGVELLAGRHDRFARLVQVGDVVERVVQAEDVDPVLGGRGDETADEVGADGARADEETAAERQPEWRRRPRLQRPDPLPGALDAAADGRVEDAAARDLEQREAGTIEHLRDPQQLPGRDLPGERLLREQANSRIDKPRHVRSLPSAVLESGSNAASSPRHPLVTAESDRGPDGREHISTPVTRGEVLLDHRSSTGQSHIGGGAMRTTKAKVLSVLLVTALAAAGLLAAVAIARPQPQPQPQPRSLEQQQPARRQPAHVPQSGQPLPVGGASQASLFLPD